MAEDKEYVPLHFKIREQIIASFAEMELGTQLPPDRQMSKSFDISLMTMKRVLSDLERDGFIVRQQGKGTFLVSREKCIQNDAQVLGSSANGRILVAVPNYHSYEYWYTVYRAETLALHNRMECIEYKMRRETDYTQLLRFAADQESLTGMIISPVPGSLTPKVLDEFRALEIPVVFLADVRNIKNGDNLYCVAQDWFKLGYLSISYLLENNHESIAYVNNEPLDDGGKIIKGMKEALSENDVRHRNLKMTKKKTKVWSDSAEAAYEYTKQLLQDQEFSALIVDSYSGALGSLRALLERGLVPGRDVSMISFGDQGGAEEYFPVPLTTVSVLLKESMDVAFNIINGTDAKGPQLRLLDTNIYPRASVTKRVEVEA